MVDATTAAATAEMPVAPPRKSKLLGLILIGLLVAGAAGAAAYFFAFRSDGAPAAAEGAKKAAPKLPAIYVAFEPPFVVNFEAKGVMRFLQVSVEVMTRDQPTAELVKLHDPKLRNDLLMLLGNQTLETLSTVAGKEQLRREALGAVAKVIASEGGDAAKVEELYFTSFVMQ